MMDSDGNAGTCAGAGITTTGSGSGTVVVVLLVETGLVPGSTSSSK
jgi:hypothetical protein